MILSDKEIEKFNTKLSTLLEQHYELKRAIAKNKKKASLESELATQLALSASVLWESFIHDLIVAYVLMEPEHALASKKEKVMLSIKDKFGSAVLDNIIFKTIKGSKEIIGTRVVAMLDPKGWNITARSASELMKKANEFIAAPYAMKFALDASDSEFYNYMIALRNCLSHNSSGARKVLDDAISDLTGHDNLPLTINTKTNRVSVYLKTTSPGGLSRVEYIVQRLSKVASKL